MMTMQDAREMERTMAEERERQLKPERPAYFTYESGGHDGLTCEEYQFETEDAFATAYYLAQIIVDCGDRASRPNFAEIELAQEFIVKLEARHGTVEGE